MTFDFLHTGLRSALLLLAGMYFLYLLVRSLQRGITKGGNTTFERGKQPRAYWGVLLLQLAFAGVAFWAALSPPGKETRPKHEIYAVTDAVREQLPQGRVLAFSNIRTDGRTGFVCGEFTLNESRRRFFGDVLDGKPTAVVEHQNRASFETRYRSVCRGKWVVPQTS